MRFVRRFDRSGRGCLTRTLALRDGGPEADELAVLEEPGADECVGAGHDGPVPEELVRGVQVGQQRARHQNDLQPSRLGSPAGVSCCGDGHTSLNGAGGRVWCTISKKSVRRHNVQLQARILTTYNCTTTYCLHTPYGRHFCRRAIGQQCIRDPTKACVDPSKVITGPVCDQDRETDPDVTLEPTHSLGPAAYVITSYNLLTTWAAPDFVNACTVNVKRRVESHIVCIPPVLLHVHCEVNCVEANVTYCGRPVVSIRLRHHDATEEVCVLGGAARGGAGHARSRG
eukprot:1179704-Prorocentrum_minimum.AAC.1